MSTPEDRVARAERLRRVEALYLEILARPAPERFTALAAACGSDSDLRAEVQSLLDQPHSAAGVLESHAPDMTSRPVSGTDSTLTGRRLGDFELEGLVGVGGMGEVYRARDTRLGRIVAIKILPRAFISNPDRLARFQQEARILAALDHPYICTLYDVGECQGISFLVMQYLEGETAADRLRRGPIPVAEAVKYATQIADALHAAHRAGFTHRDLKPANVVLTKNGAKVVDFGLAKLRGLSGPISMSDMVRMDTRTGKGTITGTLHYMSPEQVEGREADTRSDIWAFGVTLFEMITGRRPFEGDLPATVIGSILKDTPPPISATQVMSPPALDRLVSTCLERDPDERWQTAGDVKRQLRWILGTDSVSLSSSLPPTPRARDFPWLAVGLAAALVGVAPWAVLYWTNPTSEDLRVAQAFRRDGLKALTRFAALQIERDIEANWKTLEEAARDERLPGWLAAVENDRQKLGELQAWLERLYLVHREDLKASSWFVLGANGGQLGRFPEGELKFDPIRNFAYKSYFHGEEQEYEEGTQRKPLREPTLSTVFFSSSDECRKIAYSVPIWKPGDDSQPVGVLVMTLTLGDVDLIDIQVDEQGQPEAGAHALLIDLRADWKDRQGTVLQHPVFREERLDPDQAPLVSDATIAQLDGIRRRTSSRGVVPEIAHDFVDPILKESRMAAIAPVRVRGTKIGWFVVVTEPPSPGLAAPLRLSIAPQ